MNELLRRGMRGIAVRLGFNHSDQESDVTDQNENDLGARITALERRIDDMQNDIDELRADSLKIAELYDLVFERLTKGQ